MGEPTPSTSTTALKASQHGMFGRRGRIRKSEAGESVIDWWLSKAEVLPIMAETALVILTAPVSEVATERLFSDLKIILTKFRSLLKGILLSAVLFLRLNKKFNEKFNDGKL